MKIMRPSVSFDEMFKDDIDQYYTVFNKYIILTTVDYTGAYKIAKDALALADRWNDISADAKKLSTARECNKTDLQKYCYGKYRQMQLIHEHCRSVWKTGEDEMSVKKYIKGRRD